MLTLHIPAWFIKEVCISEPAFWCLQKIFCFQRFFSTSPLVGCFRQWHHLKGNLMVINNFFYRFKHAYTSIAYKEACKSKPVCWLLWVKGLNLKRLDTRTFTYATPTFINEAHRTVIQVQLLLMTATVN